MTERISRCRSLPLQPGLEFPELADVLDGDDGLGGEGLYQRNFVIREGSLFSSRNRRRNTSPMDLPPSIKGTKPVSRCECRLSP